MPVWNREPGKPRLFYYHLRGEQSMARESATKRQKKAMELIAGGAPLDDVAQEIGVTVSTIRSWLRSSVCQEEYRACFKNTNLVEYARARAVLSRQLGDQNPWVAQNAAREMLNRTEGEALGKEDAALRVEVVGMPQLGTPDMEGDGAGLTD